MRKFLFKALIALGLVILIHVISAYLFANGKIDDFYLRFTTERQHSFVLGNSRAAQGIVPHVVDENITALNIEGSLFNYGFTLGTSPYGPYYLESIKKKLNPNTKNGLFIVCVDPWSISSDANLNKDDPANYEEAEAIPYNMRFVNLDPNWEYLVKNFHKGWGDMIISNTVRTTQMELHSDGWLEITIPMNKKRQEQRIESKLRQYKEDHFYSKKFSTVRLNYLRETIAYLKSFGSVVMVRIPLHKRMEEIEKEYMPDFDKLMKSCSQSLDVPYLNYVEDDHTYITTDGNHLYKEDAKLFSELLARDIANRVAYKK